MFQYSAFEDDFSTQYGITQKQFWQINTDDTKEVLMWLNNEVKNQGLRWMDDFWEMRQNLARYEGRYYNEPDQRLSRQRGNYQRLNPFARKYNKIAVNHLRDFTEARTARLCKFRPAFAIVPATNEYEDKVDARVAERVVKAIWNNEDIERLTIQWVRAADVMGESYLFTLWNPFKGPIHPIAQGAPADMPLSDSSDIMSTDGSVKTLTAGAVRVGDIDFKLFLATQVYLQNRRRYDDVDWIMPFERKPVAELQLMYPNHDGEIRADRVEMEYQEDPLQTGQMNEEATVYYFYHRPTLALPKGKMIVWTKTSVLANEDYPFQTDDIPGMLPCVRLVADEVPGKLRGCSLYRHLKPLNDHLNTLTTMIVRQQILCAHPKWMVPYGSVKPENLGNDITLVQYKGPQAPQLVAFSPSAPELFTFRQQLKEDLQTLSLVFGTSRGEPPPGVKAAVALQFLSEQENERSQLSVVRFQESIRELVQKTIMVVANKYEDEDERILKSVGSWTGSDEEVINFKVSQLKKKFNVRIQNSSSLPDSKAQRIQNILDLSERFPDRFDADQVLEMMGMAAETKFIDQATLAVNAAEAENERIMQMGIASPEDGYVEESLDKIAPQEWENHIEHWKTHTKCMQELRFKFLPPQLQQAMKDHVLATEMFMIQKAQESNKYAALIDNLQGFPMFFKVPPPETNIVAQDQQMAQAAMAEGMAQPTIPQG